MISIKTRICCEYSFKHTYQGSRLWAQCLPLPSYLQPIKYLLMVWYRERSHQEYTPDLTSLYPAIYCPDTLQVLQCAPGRIWMLCKSSCPQNSVSNMQFHSTIHDKSCDWFAWRLQSLRDDWNSSIKLVVALWSRKLSISLRKQSSVVVPSNVKLNITLISECSDWFPLLDLQSCLVLASPLSVCSCDEWGFMEDGSNQQTWASRRDLISVSGDGFQHPKWSSPFNTKPQISRTEKSRGRWSLTTDGLGSHLSSSLPLVILCISWLQNNNVVTGEAGCQEGCPVQGL